jgi:hypothetical protein
MALPKVWFLQLLLLALYLAFVTLFLFILILSTNLVFV